MMPDKIPPASETRQFNYDSRELVAKLDQIIDLLQHRSTMARYMDVPAAAVYLTRTEIAVRHLIKRGVIPICKLDGKNMIDRIELDKAVRRIG